jgi:hypothetical protein
MALLIAVAVIASACGGGSQSSKPPGWSSADREKFLTSGVSVGGLGGLPYSQAVALVGSCELRVTMRRFKNYDAFNAAANAPGTLPEWQRYDGEIEAKCIQPAGG